MLKSTQIDTNKNTLNIQTNNNSNFTMSNGVESQEPTIHLDNYDNDILPVLPGSHVPHVTLKN